MNRWNHGLDKVKERISHFEDKSDDIIRIKHREGGMKNLKEI